MTTESKNSTIGEGARPAIGRSGLSPGVWAVAIAAILVLTIWSGVLPRVPW